LNAAETPQISHSLTGSSGLLMHWLATVAGTVFRHATAGFLALLVFYLSLVTTSAPVGAENMESIERAIAVLETKGFDREVFLLRNVATFRSSDNWLNGLNPEENAFAATNFPFEIITVYPDFYTKTTDDTERAMILLHEAQHLQNADEQQAYTRVWRERERIGWTALSHGTTPTYITVELLTRENAPELFECNSRLWRDCTEKLRAKR